MLLLQMEAGRRIVFVALVYVQGREFVPFHRNLFIVRSNIFARFG